MQISNHIQVARILHHILIQVRKIISPNTVKIKLHHEKMTNKIAMYQKQETSKYEDDPNPPTKTRFRINKHLKND